MNKMFNLFKNILIFLLFDPTEIVRAINRLNSAELKYINKVLTINNGRQLLVSSLFDYGDPDTKLLIHRLKYHSDILAKKFFANVLNEYLLNILDEDTQFNLDKMPIITIVPTTEKKLKEKGFHQISILFDYFNTDIKKLIDEELLLKVKDTISQTKLSRQKRLRNVIGAFAANKQKLNKIKDSHIIIIDDVITTGATINQCASKLVTAGAKRVDIITLASQHG